MVARRIDYVLVDELGMDPLRDTSFDAIMSVQSWEPYTVEFSKRYNPQAISYAFYGTVDLWYAILYYNKIADGFALKEGTQLRIPNINELTSALTKSKAADTAVRTIRI